MYSAIQVDLDGLWTYQRYLNKEGSKESCDPVYSKGVELFLDLFKTNPEQFLQETSDLVVCPVCLAEKPIAVTVEQKLNGKTFNFCRCPYCMDMFRQEPEYFVKRLAWQTNYAGILGESGGCCAKKQ